jgi:hypothetical protein
VRYVPGEPTEITFDKSKELQALGWACSEMRAANPEDPEMVTAYDAALRATHVRHSSSESYDFSLRGEEADIVLSVLKRWVELGSPAKEDKVTYAARAKSYKTAKGIVEQTIQLT